MGHGLRVAVLGQGSIGRRHAGLLRGLGAEVVTFDPFSPADTDDEARALDGAAVAVVASPSAEHEAQALRCIAAGVPVLVEKPLALDAWGGARVAAAGARAGVGVAVAMNLRHHPGVQGVRAALPQIGRPLRAAVWCGSYLPGWRPGADYRQAYSAQRALGGGVLLDAIHEIDELLWLLGPVRSVAALLPQVSDLELDVEDVAQLQLELASGVPATVTLDYLDREYHRGARVVGAEATVAWDWTAEQVVVHGGDGARAVVPAAADAAPTYREELAALLASVEAGGGALAGASPADGHHALQVVDAARVSAATGRRVPIGLALRPAGLEDAERLRAWRNEPATVAASLTAAEVDEAEHRVWLSRVLAAGDRTLWIVEDSGRPAGSVRLDLVGDGSAEVSIALDAAARGLGLAATALELLTARARAAGAVTGLLARVRESNAPSLRAFARAGYAEAGRADGVVTLRRTVP
ncbi:MAG: putative dehydrogenase [Conexibacter sp.]|nr:putative dehydrogenase [Conexibacter sp.]